MRNLPVSFYVFISSKLITAMPVDTGKRRPKIQIQGFAF